MDMRLADRLIIAATTYDDKLRAFDKSNGKLLWVRGWEERRAERRNLPGVRAAEA